MKILIVEDDLHILSFLKRGFYEEGFIIDSATDGLDGEYLAFTNSYDVIILDLMLPSKDGLKIVKNLREKHIFTPILILSAKGEVEERIQGLQIGADDYLPKPFSFEELKVRVEALHRRSVTLGQNIITIANVTINLNTKSVMVENRKVQLSLKEYELLLFLIKYKNSIVSKSMIENQLWSMHEFINSNVIEVTIYNLRKKLGKDIIINYRNLGYKIED